MSIPAAATTFGPMADLGTPAPGNAADPAANHRSRVSSEDAAERLIETTIEMLHEVPFTQLSVRTITERADLNKSTVERCFGSIESLYRAASQRLLSRVVAALADQADPSPFANPDMALATRFRAWLVTGGVDGQLLRPPPGDPDAALLAGRQARLGGLSDLTSQTFHFVAALLVEGYSVFNETHTINDEVRLNLLFMLNEFVALLPAIEADLGWVDRSAISVDGIG